MKKILKKRDLSALLYFIFFLAALAFWEIFLRVTVSGGLDSHNAVLFVFLPAEAAFFTAFCGFHKKLRPVNGVVMTLLQALIAVYYYAQYIYFSTFGSLFSISMAGMGAEALGNFGWTIRETIEESVPVMFLLLIPAFLAALFSFTAYKKRKEKEGLMSPCGGYALWLHGAVLVLSAALWFGTVFSLGAFGKEKGSAWYVFHDATSDTDMSSSRLGALATSVVESGARFLNTGDDKSASLAEAVDSEALKAVKKPAPTAAPAAAIVSEDTLSENEPEPVRRHEFEEIDFAALKNESNDEIVKALCDYFGAKESMEVNEYTGLFKDYNLIYICAEAFSDYGIDPEITPVLWDMAHSGIVLHNYYNSYINTTTNGEFSLDLSLWPDVSRTADRGAAAGSFPQSAALYMPFGLGKLFTAEGAVAYGYHDYLGDYYKRRLSWANLGYEQLKFMDEGMTFSSYWPASDLEMFEQSMEDYVNEDRFHANYMTFSGHGPYRPSNEMYVRNIAEVTNRGIYDKYSDITVIGYFCGEFELERAMEYMLKRLEEAGKLENTVIVLSGDHFPYQVPESARKDLNHGEELDTVFEQYHSTCIIYNAGLKEPIDCYEYCCNVDILPTVLNLMDIPYDSRLLMGTDVFSDGVHRARLYNGSFLTDYVYYDKNSGEARYVYEGDELGEEELEAYFEAMRDYTEKEYVASINMLKTDFYLYVWEHSGLMTHEEADMERARQDVARKKLAEGGNGQ
ncbi:MAG: sulfatase-like hydrolase/transferase [Lachnospiraceae bacterium]|nr:sulfatase-like hydrolase/transferase [Lachnospiraceae bacterium]